MASPTFSQLNGEVKTTLRIYDSEAKKYKYRIECKDENAACTYKLLTPQDSFLPFQFYRPTSVLGITSWKVYDLSGNEVLSFDSDTMDLLSIRRYVQFDSITYNGQALGETLESGFYYFVIVTAGESYYSEDFYVACSPDGEDAVTEPMFESGVSDTEDWNFGDASQNTDYTHLLVFTIGGSGPPVAAASSYTDQSVASFGDNKLWISDGSSWIETAVSNGTKWVTESGQWYLFSAGAWSGVAGAKPVTITAGESVCWDGSTGNNTPIFIAVNGEELNYRIEFVVTNYVSGSVAVYAGDGPAASGFLASADGTFSFTQFMANGYTISIVPDEGFQGCISQVHAYKTIGLDNCNMKLSWTNCGRVGNIVYPGLTNVFYLAADTILPRAESKLFIESEEDENGEKQEVRRRKETTYSLFLGILPPPVVDALTEMCLHETVQLFYPNGESDALFHCQVDAPRNDAFSKCLAPTTLTFQMFNSAVACCDDFDAPCLTSCVDAEGFTDGDMDTDNVYLNPNAPEYSIYTGGGLTTPTLCDSGLANITFHGGFLYTVIWDLTSGTWEKVALNTLAEVTPASVGTCTIVFRFNVYTGYYGVLEYYDGSNWVEWEGMTMSASEWASNITEVSLDDGSTTVRLKVKVGDCTIGYSEEVTFSCE